MTLTLAIPSKGRLQEQAAAYLADAGMPLKQSAGARGYRATLQGTDGVDVLLLSASEIAAALLSGDVHLGITGEDLLREIAPEMESRIALLHPLGFGFADVVVAVPQAWIDVSAMSDLDDVCAAFVHRHRRRLRIATKYVHLTRAFFAHAGITDYRIVESAGATEGAPTAGTAEAIVDITTTGATLAANGLKTLDDGTILQSQAQLAASLAAGWGAGELARAHALLSRLSARERARAGHVIRVRIDDGSAGTLEALAALGVTVMARPRHEAGEYALLCPRERLMEAADILGGAGRSAAAVHDVDYVFHDGDPLSGRLDAALATAAKPGPP
jgi:ATP phosphoribosyltransferase